MEKVKLTKDDLEFMVEALVNYKARLREIDDRLTKFGMSDNDAKMSLEVMKDLNKCDKLLDKLRKILPEE